MKTLIILLTLSCLILTSINAQPLFDPSAKTTIVKVEVNDGATTATEGNMNNQVEINSNTLVSLEELEGLDADTIKDRFVSYQSDYRNRFEKWKKNKYKEAFNSDGTLKTDEIITVVPNEKHRDFLLAMVFDPSGIHTGKVVLTTNKRDAKAITFAAIAGPIYQIDSSVGEALSPYLELGARLSGMRINWLTNYRFEIGTDGAITEHIRKRYIYFDFISRPVLALDTLQSSLSEYLNSTAGSPLTLRYKYNVEMSRPQSQISTGMKEPKSYFQFSLDGRMIPIMNNGSLEELGFSGNFMPSLTFAFPAGSNDNQKDIDDLFIELDGNFYYNSKVVTEEINFNTPIESLDYTDNMGMSAQLLIGLVTENSTNNFNLKVSFALPGFDWKEHTVTCGLTFTPQTTRTPAEN